MKVVLVVDSLTLGKLAFTDRGLTGFGKLMTNVFPPNQRLRLLNSFGENLETNRPLSTPPLNARSFTSNLRDSA